MPVKSSMEKTASSGSNRRRPFGITVIIILLIFNVVVTGMILFLSLGSETGTITLLLLNITDPLVLKWALAAILTIEVAMVIGLWRLDHWAWFILMLQVGISMAADLWSYYFYHEFSTFSMLINIAIVFYLNQSEVQKAFAGETAGEKWMI